MRSTALRPSSGFQPEPQNITVPVAGSRLARVDAGNSHCGQAVADRSVFAGSGIPRTSMSRCRTLLEHHLCGCSEGPSLPLLPQELLGRQLVWSFLCLGAVRAFVETPYRGVCRTSIMPAWAERRFPVFRVEFEDVAPHRSRRRGLVRSWRPLNTFPFGDLLGRDEAVPGLGTAGEGSGKPAQDAPGPGRQPVGGPRLRPRRIETSAFADFRACPRIWSFT